MRNRAKTVGDWLILRSLRSKMCLSPSPHQHLPPKGSSCPSDCARFAIALVGIAAATFFAARHAQSIPADIATKKPRLRNPHLHRPKTGKLPELLKRFREHTTKLFEKHGMTNIGYWTPTDEPRSKNTLIYILAHDSREAAKKSWDAFQHDPDWIKVKEASEADGKLVNKVESVYATPTDFSAIK